jgi:hypothetical protein
MICRRCDRDLSESKFRSRTIRNRIYRLRVCFSCCMKKWDARLRLEFLREFGGRCSCCGESHPMFLTLEHIRGKVDKHCENATHMQIAKAKREGWDRTKYEALCWNCNMAKAMHGQCPHRTGVTAEIVYENLERQATSLSRRGFTPEERERGREARWAGKRAVDKVLSDIEKVS